MRHSRCPPLAPNASRLAGQMPIPGAWKGTRSWALPWVTSLAWWAVLTVKEAAAAVRLTQWAIYRAIQRGELTAYKPCGRVRIHKDDLDAWLESTRVPVEARAAAAPLAVLPPIAAGRRIPRR